jgi:class 3 adenylate cyclase/CHASE2 domain-containing sensor protein
MRGWLFRLSGRPWLIVPLVGILAAAWLILSRAEYDRVSVTTDLSAETTSNLDPLQLIELSLFDWRVSLAKANHPPVSSDLALVAIQDETIERLRHGYPFGEPYGLLLPRFLFGRALRALVDEGVRLVAFDTVLTEERADHPAVEIEPGQFTGSDAFFAEQMRASQRAVLASPLGAPPAALFRSSGVTLGAVDRTVDSDGVTRRVPAFLDHHLLSLPLLRFASRRQLEVRWNGGKQLQFINHLQLETNSLPIGTNGTVLVGLGKSEDSITNLSKGRIELPALATNRVWNMGILMAASRLGLNLASARLVPGFIEVPSTNGLPVRLPVDRSNNLLIAWSLSATEVPVRNFEDVLANDLVRQSNQVSDLPDRWKDKLVLVGSTATGDNLTDRGATPLDKRDYLVAVYLNVANSLIQNRFITRLEVWQEGVLAGLFALLAGVVTWKFRTSVAVFTVLGAGAVYFVAAVLLFIESQLWLPIAHPLGAGLLLSHGVTLAYRTVFEQKERQRVRSVFAKIVSPNVVQELLKAERLGLGGARRRVTVFFADVRGFTEMTDRVQAAAEEHVRTHQLANAEQEAYFDAQAEELLGTVNQYLAAIADVIKARGGTLDKYIGDCVMAFWGAPTTSPRHAVDGVLAAIDAQRAVQRLNDNRAQENARREAENVQRLARGESALPVLSLLALGTGINTGTATVGLMGSDAHIVNYTVFGREVNLASRLEGVSGRSRIIIGEGTFREFETLAPEVAALCRPLEPVTVKGFRQAVKVYEVAWQQGLA